MKDLKPLYDILGKDDTTEEVYTSDQRKRYKRGQKGLYSRQKGLFNFLQLIKDWQSIVGDFMAQNTIPLKIRSGTLIISTKHSIFAQELSFLAPTLLKKIKEKFPELDGKLNKIHFSYSDFTAKQFDTPQKQKEINKPKKEIHRFSPEYQYKVQNAQKLFSDISDDELREQLINFYISNPS